MFTSSRIQKNIAKLELAKKEQNAGASYSTFNRNVFEFEEYIATEVKPPSSIMSMPHLNAAVNGCYPDSLDCRSGFEARSFNIVAAETGAGKSTFMMHAFGSFLKANQPCLYFAIEETKINVFTKFFSWWLSNMDTGLNLNCSVNHLKTVREWLAYAYNHNGQFPKYTFGDKPREITKEMIEEAEQLDTLYHMVIAEFKGWFEFGDKDKTLEDVVEELRDKYNVNSYRHIFLDHLSVLKTRREAEFIGNPWEKQKYILDYIKDAWLKYDVTFWTAAQFSKQNNTGGSSRLRTAQDIGGLSDIGNLAFNIIAIEKTPDIKELNERLRDNKINESYAQCRLVKSRDGWADWSTYLKMDGSSRYLTEARMLPNKDQYPKRSEQQK